MYFVGLISQRKCSDTEKKNGDFRLKVAIFIELFITVKLVSSLSTFFQNLSRFTIFVGAVKFVKRDCKIWVIGA